MDRKCLHVLVLAHLLVISIIDYCNSLYVSLPNYLLRELHFVVNRSARLIYSLLGFLLPHILLSCIGYPVKARIEFKICLLVVKALKYGEPRHVADLLNLENVHV